MRMRSILVSAVTSSPRPRRQRSCRPSPRRDASATTNSLLGDYDSTATMTRPVPRATPRFPSNNGPVWAIDSLTEKWAMSAYATPQTDGANYSVLLKVTAGSKFSQFANPLAARSLWTGKVHGVLQYDVQSSNAPGSR